MFRRGEKSGGGCFVTLRLKMQLWKFLHIAHFSPNYVVASHLKTL